MKDTITKILSRLSAAILGLLECISKSLLGQIDDAFTISRKVIDREMTLSEALIASMVRGVDISVKLVFGPITFDDKSTLLRMLGSIPFALGFLAGKCARLLNSYMRARRVAAEQRAQQPPRLAEYLLYFLPKAQREPLLGDMEEVYGVLLNDQGKRRAQFWYWCQVFMAFKPLWSNKIIKRLAKWAAITGLGQLLGRVIPWEGVRRVLPLGEWIRRIIS